MIEKTNSNFYNQATQNILEQIKSLGMNAEDTKKAIDTAKMFRASFRLRNVKKKTFYTPDSPLYMLGYDSGGFCRIASSIFMVVMGAADWDLMIVDKESWEYGPHHYLRYRLNGKILDLTYDQYATRGIKVPYELGRPVEDPGATIITDGIKFAKALGIDIYEALKENSRRAK